MQIEQVRLELIEEGIYWPQLNRYEPREILGRGSFATVVAAYDKVQRMNVAIKIVEKKLFKTKESEEIIRQEAITLQTLIHRNIIQILGFVETSNRFFIVMNQIDGVTLESYIKTIKPHEVNIITKQILSALSYLHKKNIVHRDIKPENILISLNDLKITLIDFGLSAQVNRNEESLMHQNCGTLLYQAPELIKKLKYTRSVDIWALGIVVYNMLHKGNHPFYVAGETRMSYSEKIKNFSLNLSLTDKNAKNFLERTIAYLPENRLSADQCLEHPFITGEGDISIPLTLNEMIQFEMQKQKNIAKYIKLIIFLKYLKKNIYFRDEINEAGSPKDNISIAGSELSMNSHVFRIRPLMMKSQTRLNKLTSNDSSNNSFYGDSSRNTTDMIPETIIKQDIKNTLRKSNSMNPNTFKIQLKKQQPIQIPIQIPKTKRVHMITESLDNRVKNSPLTKNRRIQRSTFSKKPEQL